MASNPGKTGIHMVEDRGLGIYTVLRLGGSPRLQAWQAISDSRSIQRVYGHNVVAGSA